MSFPQKRQVNVAAASKRVFDLSHAHITTTDFGRMKPIECRYMVPGDEFNYNINSMTRVINSMPSPTYGKFDVVYRGFFVPIHNIWSPFYDYIKNQPTLIDGEEIIIECPPYATPEDFYNYFTNTNFGLTERVTEDPITEGMYDFYSQSGSSPVYYKFTRLGRVHYDFLTSLGLNIPLDRRDSTTKINLLPLVAFWKAYFDWIVPSRFILNHQDYIQKFIQNISSNGLSGEGAYHVTSLELHNYLVHEPLAYFIDDVFTTSTEFPFQDSTSLQDAVELRNPSLSFNGIGVDGGAPVSEFINGAYAFPESDNNTFNMWTLQTLGKLQDMLNRQLLVGSKVQDWLLSEFGIRPNNDALHLSTYLGSKRNTLSIGDVMSTSDTLSEDGKTGVSLGSYGGYIKERFDFDFNYKANEHGYFFITFELVPRTSYYQGLTPEFDMIDRFDFFQPEFDNQQGAPIPFRNLYFDSKTITGQNRPDSKFGFTLQYSLLKQATDVVSGDFRNRFGLALKSWFLTRDMSYLKMSQVHVNGIDEEFCLVKSAYQDWHYIFSDMTDQLDPFMVAFYIQNRARRPMKSISEGFEPTYKNSGKDVALDFSGSVN